MTVKCYFSKIIPLEVKFPAKIHAAIKFSSYNPGNSPFDGRYCTSYWVSCVSLNFM